ncbi:MAG: hypothetical protein ACREH6_03280, partial [Geminicoccaceae bacterium]
MSATDPPTRAADHPRCRLQRADAPPVVLASASPIRAELLAAAGVSVTRRPAAVDEAEVKAALRAEGASPV